MRTHQLIGSVRTFVADDGVTWIVSEHLDGYADDAAAEVHSLVFDCGSVFRRIREFPADWRERDADGLLELSWAR